MLESVTFKQLLDECYRAHSGSVGDCVDACVKSACCQSYIFVVNVCNLKQLMGGRV